MRERVLRVGADGSLTLPAEALHLLGSTGGGDVVLRVEEGRVVLVSAAAAANERRSLPAPAPAARAWTAPYAEHEEEG